MRPTHLIDVLIPSFDKTIVHEVSVDAAPEVVFDAVRSMDFLMVRSPMITTLFTLRNAPGRLSRRLRGQVNPPPLPAARLADLFDGTVSGEWVGLAEDRPHEIVFGAVGTVWQPTIRWQVVAANDFTAFSDPGYAKMAVAFATRSGDRGSTILSYEARTTTTDAHSKARFGRYWLLVRPFVRLVMRAALHTARDQAELRGVS
jgi:hypothetical protein